MADNENIFRSTVDSLMDGMNGMLSTKTVVGEAINIGDTIILPLVDVSFGVGAGIFKNEKKDSGFSGLGGKMIPSAVLVIQGGTTRLINVREQDGLSKLLDMIPDFVGKFMGSMGFSKKFGGGYTDEEEQEAKEAAMDEMEQMLDDAVNPKE